MKREFLLLAGMLLLSACARDAVDNRSSGERTAADTAASSGVLSLNGETAYNEYCAGCHETGMLGAPVAGDAMDWGTRSRLWDAVLLDHAITGYLEMPARGVAVAVVPVVTVSTNSLPSFTTLNKALALGAMMVKRPLRRGVT